MEEKAEEKLSQANTPKNNKASSATPKRRTPSSASRAPKNTPKAPKAKSGTGLNGSSSKKASTTPRKRRPTIQILDDEAEDEASIERVETYKTPKTPKSNNRKDTSAIEKAKAEAMIEQEARINARLTPKSKKKGGNLTTPSGSSIQKEMSVFTTLKDTWSSSKIIVTEMISPKIDISKFKPDFSSIIDIALIKSCIWGILAAITAVVLFPLIFVGESDQNRLRDKILEELCSGKNNNLTLSTKFSTHYKRELDQYNATLNLQKADESWDVKDKYDFIGPWSKPSCYLKAVTYDYKSDTKKMIHQKIENICNYIYDYIYDHKFYIILVLSILFILFTTFRNLRKKFEFNNKVKKLNREVTNFLVTKPEGFTKSQVRDFAYRDVWKVEKGEITFLVYILNFIFRWDRKDKEEFEKVWSKTIEKLEKDSRFSHFVPRDSLNPNDPVWQYQTARTPSSSRVKAFQFF